MPKKNHMSRTLPIFNSDIFEDDSPTQGGEMRVWQIAKQVGMKKSKPILDMFSTIKSSSSKVEPIFAQVLIDYFTGKKNATTE